MIVSAKSPLDHELLLLFVVLIKLARVTYYSSFDWLPAGARSSGAEVKRICSCKLS